MTRPVAHDPVLASETLELLAPVSGEVVVDATLGAGGHAEALLRAVGPAGRVVAIDRDPVALEIAGRRLGGPRPGFTALHGDHRELPALLEGAGVRVVDRMLFDLGVSSMQLDDPGRGFSFREDGPLDMRMDPGDETTAADLVASLPERELSRILWRYGEERRSRAIARAIVREREQRPIETTVQLARLVEGVHGHSARRYRIHPATRTFQALRVAVNRELEGLELLLEQAVGLLRGGGRLAVISFHSLEDRQVKTAFRSMARRCTCPPKMPVCGCGRRDLVRVITSRPVRPSAGEIERNPRARSARLRVVERL